MTKSKTTAAKTAAAPKATPAASAPVAAQPTADAAKATDAATTDSETAGAAVLQLTRLSAARGLPEVSADTKSKPASEKHAAFQSFKGEDGRTMNVVLVGGALAQQEVAS